MRFSELVADLPGLIRQGGEGGVSGITIDSRRATRGSLFICLPGTQVDPHDYIRSAIEAGASAAVVTRREAADALERDSIAFALVEDSVDACWRLCKRFYGDPTSRMKAVGVTGTNGKTTVAWILSQVLEAAGLPSAYLGTLGAVVAGKKLAASLTTPFPPETYCILSEAAAQGARVALMEVSSHALSQRRVDGLEFDVGVFTNLSQDHLDFHRDMNDYFAAKRRLFDGLPTSKKIVTVANADDPYGRNLLEEAELPVGFGENAGQLRLLSAEVGLDAIGMDVEYAGSGFRITAPLGARFNVSNCLAAFGAAVALGVEPAKASAAFARISPVPGRFESVPSGADFKVIVDYAHTPDALEKLLQSVRELNPKRVVTVFGCGGDRDRTKRPKMAAAASLLSDVVYVTSDNPRTEDPQRIIDDILPGIVSAELIVEPDRRLAIELAIAGAIAGDVIVIAGKGHEDYQILSTGKIQFDDRKVAAEAIEKRPSCV